MPSLDTVQIDYTSRDYAAFKQDMVNLISQYVPEWTNQTESDFGIVLIELFAHIADSLAYYQDRQANEAFLPTAKLRSNVIKLCGLINYQLGGAKPSTAVETFTITPDPLNVRSIPAGSLVSTPSGSSLGQIIFELLAPITVPANATSVTGIVTQGSTITGEVIGVGTGLPNQAFPLSQIPVILPSISNQNAIVIQVNSGAGYVTWTRVDSVISATATSTSWYFSQDENGVVTIQFGDGITGQPPPSNATIQATYRTGGGLSTNVGAGTITVPLNLPSFVTAVNNASNASGGDDPETLDHARVYAPLSLKRMNRAVTIQDYISVASGFSGVLQAGAVVSPAFAATTVNVYVLPTGGGTPTPAFLASLQSYLQNFSMASVFVNVYGANIALLDVAALVIVSANYNQAAVLVSCQSAMNSFFTSGNLAFGQGVNLGDLYKLLETVTGVDHVDISKLTIEPVLYTVKSSGNPVFSNMAGSAISTRETWTVSATDSTHFKVTGSVSGLQVGTGTFGAAYTTDAGGLTFKITAGNVPTLPGDNWTIRTSVYLGNVSCLPLEVIQLGVQTLTAVGGV